MNKRGNGTFSFFSKDRRFLDKGFSMAKQESDLKITEEVLYASTPPISLIFTIIKQCLFIPSCKHESCLSTAVLRAET